MSTRKLSHSELSAICQELYLLLHAGVDTGSGLTMMAEEAEGTSTHALLKGMAEEADFGQSLSAVMKQTGVFPAALCALIDVGERTGHLEETLRSLAAYHQRRADLDRHIRSALLYPAILLLLMLIVIVVLLTQVLPVFNEVYTYLGGRLTGVAGGLLNFGTALNSALPFLGVLLAIVVVFCLAFACSVPLRTRLAAMWQKSWGDKGVSRMLNTAQFAQALSMGYSSGLPLDEAVELAASLFPNLPAMQKRCAECVDQLAMGESLTKALGDSDLLPRTECRLLELANRSGAGDQVMEQIAQRLSDESEAALETRLGQIEPTLVICSSLLVGLILLSVMLPLVHIMTAIG